MLEYLEESRAEWYRYQDRLEEARKRISEMSKEQRKKILSLPQNSNVFDITSLSEEDRVVMNEICNIEINKSISTMNEDELHSKQQELWDKHVKSCKSRKDNEPLTVYESSFLVSIESEIRKLNAKGKEPEISEA